MNIQPLVRLLNTPNHALKSIIFVQLIPNTTPSYDPIISVMGFDLMVELKYERAREIKIKNSYDVRYKISVPEAQLHYTSRLIKDDINILILRGYPYNKVFINAENKYLEPFMSRIG